MKGHLPPERIEQLIANAVRQGRRHQTLRRGVRGTAALIAVAAIAVGVATALDGIGFSPNPTEATPATPPNPTTPEKSPPSTATPLPTTTPEPPRDEATDHFSTTYTEAEQAVILQELSPWLDGKNLEDFTALVTRTTRGEGLDALSPDDDTRNVDATPVFALRISGPLEGTLITQKGPGDDEEIELELIGIYMLIGTDGYDTGARIYQRPEGSKADLPSPPIGPRWGPSMAWDMPPVAPSTEHDVVAIDLKQVNLPPLATDQPPPLSEEDQARADELLTTFESLLPAGIEVTELLNSTPDGAVFTLSGTHGTTRSMIALWHLATEAELCQGNLECAAVPVDDGTVYIDTTHDSPGAPTRFYTYRRSDNAAIYFTMNINPDENQGAGDQLALSLTEDQMIRLLTHPAWAPFLDLKKAEPPQ